MGHVAGDRRHVTRAVCRWGTDYLLKCHVSEHELYGQVGSPELDHAVWTRPEDSEVERETKIHTKLCNPGKGLC